MRLASVALLSLAILLGACAAAPRPERARGYLNAEECSALPGLAPFRAEIGRVVAARDGTAFRALFHPDGAMRVEGIGGDRSTQDWGLGRSEAARVWVVLDQILALGCVEREGHAHLPAMSGLVEDGAVETEYDMALADLAVHSRMDETSPVLRRFKAGDLLYTVSYSEGWVEVLVGERQGYVRADLLRSPHGYQMQLRQEGGRWYIREFGGGV